MRNTLEESLEVVVATAEKKKLELVCDTTALLPHPQVLYVGDALRLRQVSARE